MTLSAAEAAGYRDDGFVVVRELFEASEVAIWLAECDRIEASGVMHPDNLRTHVLNSPRPPDRLDPVIDLSPALRDLATGSRLCSLASQLLGEEAALFKDKLIFKPAGMRGYAAHQDYAYWQWMAPAAPSMLTILVTFDEATAANGAVELFGGLHDRLLTEAGQPADIPGSALPAHGFVAETRPGDVVAFHSLAPHRSGDNRTAAPRRQLFLSYCAAAYGDVYGQFYDGRHSYLMDNMPAESRARAYFR